MFSNFLVFFGFLEPEIASDTIFIWFCHSKKKLARPGKEQYN